ncbi:MAG TPA: diaminopimelate decarboxylase [Clostridia bacterium]|nr:diaminopimelate decarboxylase [Clostridia bacterium]
MNMRNRQLSINNKGHLEFSGCDTVELAESYGTPLYVMSEDGIRNNCRKIKTALTDKYPGALALYASKAFSSRAIYRIMAEEGFGVDVVSGGELYTANMAGFPMERVYFHGNNKTPDEIELGLDLGIGHFVVDNYNEIRLLDKAASKGNKAVRVLIRVSPGVSAHTHEYISTGQLDSKFGFPIEGGDALKAAGIILESPHMELSGIHCHIGSQIFNQGAHGEAAKVMLGLLLQIKERYGIELEELNIGGGFGIFYREGDEPPAIEEYISVITDTVKALCSDNGLKLPRIIIEPGRWIVGENGITLYTIGAIKEIEGIRKYVSVDGGMTDNPRTALYQAEYDAIVANKAEERPEELVTIAGKCCESGDILIKDIRLPAVEPGDMLAVLSTGAYNYSMSSNYNRLRKPAVVMLKDGKPRIIVKRETYEDIVRNDME